MKRISKKTLLTILITFVSTIVLTGVVLCIVIMKYKLPFEKFVRVMNIVENTYIEEMNLDKCEEGAINGALSQLGDKYTVYYDEENAKSLMQNIDGYYIGIGVEIFANTDTGLIEVVSAYEDSPADKAGIISGDSIISIDGKKFSADKMADAVQYIKGSGTKKELGKSIKIVVERDGKEISMNVKRAKLELYKVTHEMVDDICFIRFTGFTGPSMKEFKKIVDSLDEKTTKGIVVDIRNNPGGELHSALNMCDIFLEDQTIMITKDKNGSKTVYKGKKGSCKLPLAVIVNGSSASASEVFAGALQDHKRAVIVGEKTYGKGVTQTIQYLDPRDPSKGALKLTTHKNFTPGGKWINESIKPDIEAEAEKVEGEIENDAAFKAAAEYLTKEKIGK